MAGVAKLLMAFLLLAPPVLCRGGILEQCCASTGAATAAAGEPLGCGEPCCAEEEAPAPKPVRPACGECAALCFGHFHAPDNSAQAWALVSTPAAFAVDDSLPRPAPTKLCRRPIDVPPDLPFPPSDAPLLI